MVRGNGSISICIQFDNCAPATKKSKARSCTGLFCAEMFSFDVRYTPESGHWRNIAAQWHRHTSDGQIFGRKLEIWLESGHDLSHRLNGLRQQQPTGRYVFHRRTQAPQRHQGSDRLRYYGLVVDPDRSYEFSDSASSRLVGDTGDGPHPDRFSTGVNFCVGFRTDA